ncbi:MAG: 3-deoxy-D-manno-octulosonic acid transferase [Acidobacteriota bacterium]|jgi:3-deoxy-D-manno-octulosonic-acid transferase
MYTFYTLLYLIGLGVYAPRALWRLVRRGRYRRGLGERFGHVPQRLREVDPGAVWIHAVSVGEVHAAKGIIAHISKMMPDIPVVLSTTTDTGQAMAEGAGAAACFYCPLDLPWALSPYLDTLRPRAIVLIETEIWPNLLNACHSRGVPVALVNARMSASSHRGYRRLGRPWRRIVGQLSVVCARTEREATRLRDLGVPAERVYVTGNLKADAKVLTSPVSARQQLAEKLGLNGNAPLLAAGCTMPGEEELVLQAFRAARAAAPSARLLIAPRHPERFDQVAAAIEAAGLACRRRTSGGPRDADVLLLDTIGELPAAYGLAIASFVGGSLVEGGGHNLLEPAIYGQPVLFGPHMRNFTALANEMRSAGGGIQVTSVAELADAWSSMLANARRRREVGALARRVALRDASAGLRTARIVADLIETSAE